MREGSSPPWGDEQEYTGYLEGERHMYAWCLATYGKVPSADAQAMALTRYPYESSNDKYRGFIFHDMAWHWAMLQLFGEGYWKSRPDLESPSEAYWAESSRARGWRTSNA